MLDILLINVPTISGKKSYDISINHSRSINFGLLSIASYLSEEGFSTSIIDIRSTACKNQEELFQTILNKAPLVIGLSCISGFSYTYCKELARAIKKEFSAIPIIVGGKDHVGLIARNVLIECNSIDVVVKGEGEETICQILSKLSSKVPLTSVDNIAFRDENGQIIETQETERRFANFIPKLDYKLYTNFKSYSPSIEVSRGCPYNCSFCISPRKSLKKSPFKIFSMKLICYVNYMKTINLKFILKPLSFY